MIIKNYMEDLVWQALEEILAVRPHICHCDHCRHDIAAVALNALPPKYIVTHKGETFTRIRMLETQFSTDIITAIIRAVEVVAAKPNHTGLSEEDI
jgi:competence protein ComFB